MSRTKLSARVRRLTYLLSLVSLAGIAPPSALAQSRMATEARYRLLEVRADREGLSLQSGSLSLQADGVFGRDTPGRQEVGVWSADSGLISTITSQSLGARTQFTGRAAGPWLVGVHLDREQFFPAGVTIGVKSPHSGREAEQFSIVVSADTPARTAWIPPGPRFGEPSDAVTPSARQYVALHGGVRGANEVSIAFGPVFQPTWTVETHFFIAEGPTFDDQGHAYFTPFRPENDQVLLVSVDGTTGARRFAIAGTDPGQGGAPLVLNRGGGQVVYTGGAERIVAVSAATGRILWEQTELAALLASGNGSPDEGARLMGINYHAASDSLVAVYTNGFLIALRRTTGEILGSLDLPGSPSPLPDLPEDFLTQYEEQVNAELANFDVADFEARRFLSVLLGGGVVVPNYFSVDPNSGRLWVGGTLADEADGTADGVSEFGALFGIDVSSDGTLTIASQTGFQGGSASTATVRADGERIYVADAETHVLAHNRAGQQLWSVDVGSQVVGSVAVSSFGEIYVATRRGVTKIREVGQSAEIEWNAALDDIYRRIPDGWSTGNIQLAGIGANGVMLQSSIGIRDPSTGTLLPVRMSLTLLDAATGLPINSTRAVEESIAVVSSGPDGAVVLANSPIRRIMLRAVTSGSPAQQLVAPSVTGGLTKYGIVQRFDLLARDASFAAHSMLDNAQQTLQEGGILGAQSGFSATRDLLAQTETALMQAFRAKELTAAVVVVAQERLQLAQAELSQGDVREALRQLQLLSELLNAPPR